MRQGIRIASGGGGDGETEEEMARVVVATVVVVAVGTEEAMAKVAMATEEAGWMSGGSAYTFPGFSTGPTDGGRINTRHL